MKTDIQNTSDLVRAIAKDVRAAIPRTLQHIEWSNPNFDLFDLCDRVVLVARDKWPVSFQSFDDMGGMAECLTDKICRALKEDDLWDARIVEMY